jgi:hypothetical protein
MESSLSESLATNVWKLFPFRSGNREWLIVLIKAYISLLTLSFCLGCILNALEGKTWIGRHTYREDANDDSYAHAGPIARGDTALDECFWFVFTTIHGCAFGEFMPRGTEGRLVAMFSCSLGYLFTIFMMSVIMLSQLPGEKATSLIGVLTRLGSVLWPSYSVFLAFTLAVGSFMGPFISHDGFGKNTFGTGMYWTWTVMHRAPYGDIYPDTVFGRTVTVPVGMIGLLYMPYALACIAVRCPSFTQHRDLIGRLRGSPEDALGRGYVEPPEAASSGSLQQFVMDDSYVAEEDEPGQDNPGPRTCVVLCCLLTFTLFSCLFLGVGSPKTVIQVIEHKLELDLPPGIRNAEDPVPNVAWVFWMHKNTPMDETASTLFADMTTNLENADVKAQLVTPEILSLYNVTAFPMHPAMEYLSPNHKLDYLHAYFMHHHGGSFLRFMKTSNETRGSSFRLVEHNATTWMAAEASKEVFECDESNIGDAWCKELQFKADGTTFADTQIGMSSWEKSKGPCCAKVLEFFHGSNTTQVHTFPKPEGFVMRKETAFTTAWLDLVHKHLDAKLGELKAHTPPTELCCMKKQEGYPLRWDELSGEIWPALVKTYYDHIKFLERVF